MHLCAPRPVSGSQTTPGILSHAYLPTPTGARGPCPPHRAPPAHCTEHPCPPHRADLFTPKGARGPCLSHPCPSHKHPLPTSTGAQGQAAHPPTPGPPGACCVRGRHHSLSLKGKSGQSPRSWEVSLWHPGLGSPKSPVFSFPATTEEKKRALYLLPPARP